MSCNESYDLERKGGHGRAFAAPGAEAFSSDHGCSCCGKPSGGEAATSTQGVDDSDKARDHAFYEIDSSHATEMAGGEESGEEMPRSVQLLLTGEAGLDSKPDAIVGDGLLTRTGN